MIYCWGYSADGALGNGESGLTDQTTPVSVVMPEGMKYFCTKSARKAVTACILGSGVLYYRSDTKDSVFFLEWARIPLFTFGWVMLYRHA